MDYSGVKDEKKDDYFHKYISYNNYFDYMFFYICIPAI